VGSGVQPDGKDRQVAATAGMRFGLDDLRQVRRVTAQWAERAGMPAERADGFVIAVNEIATNAVRYGSPAARLLLRIAREDMAEAQVHDDGRWTAASRAAPADQERGGMGLPLARQVCDAVEVRAGDDGTTVTLRIRILPLPRNRRAG
jgi:serine/threonine-protein kinase RsbW